MGSRIETGMSGPRRQIHSIETSRSLFKRFPCSRATNDTEVDKEMPPDGVSRNETGMSGPCRRIHPRDPVGHHFSGRNDQPTRRGLLTLTKPDADIYGFL